MLLQITDCEAPQGIAQDVTISTLSWSGHSSCVQRLLATRLDGCTAGTDGYFGVSEEV